MGEQILVSHIEEFPWHLGVYDAHCHPTDTMSSLDKIPAMKTRVLTIMATRQQDQELVAEASKKLGITKEALHLLSQPILSEIPPRRIVPAFGWHPWFSHQIYDDVSHSLEQNSEPPCKANHYKRIIIPSPEDDEFIRSLPDPRPLSGLLRHIRKNLEMYPLALIGEIGLDRTFRIPGKYMLDDHRQWDQALTPGGREGRMLSPYRVDIKHQRKILKAQLNLAGEMRRAVSAHGVAAHGVVYETFRETWRGHEKRVSSKRARKRRESVDVTHDNDDEEELDETMGTPDASKAKPFPPRICLHSYSGPSDTLRQYLHPSVPATIFFSFSRLVNFSSTASNKVVEVIKAVPDDRILVESDLHAAGEKMDGLLEEIVRKICLIKGWPLEEGVKQLGSNWTRYITGNDADPGRSHS